MLSRIIPPLFAFAFAAIGAYLTASVAVSMIEKRSEQAVLDSLTSRDINWANVRSDGLQVNLTGTAPTEAERFRAVSAAERIVDPKRVIDSFIVQSTTAIEAPDFSIEVLRDNDQINLIGLVPASLDRDRFATRIKNAAPNVELTDLSDSADFPPPPGWDAALRYSIDVLGRLPRAKISVAPGRVEIRAIANDRAEQRRLERELSSTAPGDIALSLTISAPRPVISPFTLRFVMDEAGARFDACSAESEADRAALLASAAAIGLEGTYECTIGIGAPSSDWTNNAELAMNTVARLGGGIATLSDIDIRIEALEGTAPDLFDREIGNLTAALPDLYTLTASLPETIDPEALAEIPEFILEKAENGAVELRGKVRTERMQRVIENFARARFGADQVNNGTRLAANLPEDWERTILSAMDAMVLVDNGQLDLRPDSVRVVGATGDPDARAEISRLLSANLGETRTYSLDVTYDRRLDPVIDLPTPPECVSRINEIFVGAKITFAPGSAEIAADARETLDKVADIVRQCDGVQMEIGGHTDSQGREEMNQALSQSRAEAVLAALSARRVLVGPLTARGYGETEPIADNGTETGREANRRIEFRLIETDPVEDAPDGAADTVADDPETGEENE